MAGRIKPTQGVLTHTFPSASRLPAPVAERVDDLLVRLDRALPGWASALLGDAFVRRRRPLVCNGRYLDRGALAHSPLEVTPLAGHALQTFGPEWQPIIEDALSF